MPRTSQIKHIARDGVYGYISVPADTTCTNAGDWYFMQGAFTNEVLESWDFVHPITYQGYDGAPHLFKIQISVSFTTNAGNNLVRVALFKNGSLQSNSIASVYLKNVAEETSTSLVDVIEFSAGDQVDIRVQSSQAGSLVRAANCTASLSRFFN